MFVLKCVSDAHSPRKSVIMTSIEDPNNPIGQVAQKLFKLSMFLTQMYGTLRFEYIQNVYLKCLSWFVCSRFVSVLHTHAIREADYVFNHMHTYNT